MFVIDASVALGWCFDDEASTYADSILERLTIEDALVPAVWPFEVANGLRSAERRGRVRRGEIGRLRRLLLGLPISVDDGDPRWVLGDALDAALRLDLSCYDAAYVALAAREDVPFATSDDRLRRAATAAGVEIVE